MPIAPGCSGDDEEARNRGLVLIGLVVVRVGLAWPWVSKIPWGRWPGDLSIEREHVSFDCPRMTGLVIWVVLSRLPGWFRK